MSVDGEEISEIRQAARNARAVVSVGISEKVRCGSATLFNSNLIIGEDGNILVHHRKLMSTFFEKLNWSPGDGHGLRVANTKYGKIGALICGENTNPLARYALMARGIQVHILAGQPFGLHAISIIPQSQGRRRKEAATMTISL